MSRDQKDLKASAKGRPLTRANRRKAYARCARALERRANERAVREFYDSSPKARLDCRMRSFGALPMTGRGTIW